MANFKTRIKQKNDSTANWNTANTEGFKPLQGEIIVYNDVNRIKIGDGSNTVSNVPFLDANCVHLTGSEDINGYKTFENPITIKGSISNSDIMLSATDAANNPGMAGEITWHDGEGNDGVVYIPQGQGDTLAMCYEIPDKHFTSFDVGDDLSGQILYFNTSIGYIDNYFQAVKTIAESSGGYTIDIGGPPNITLSKNGTLITTFYDFGSNKWLKSSYTLPSDFGTVTTFNDAHGSAKDSIFYTLGLAPIYEYTKLDVGDVYKKIPAVIDSTNSTSSTDALSAFQGNQLKILVNGKAPQNHASTATTYGVGIASNYGHVKVISGDLNGKTPQDGYAASQSHTHSQYASNVNPSFTGNANIGGNLTVNGTATFQDEIRVNSSAGVLGQVLMSQGGGNSPQWKDIPTPSNMVTTDTNQTITGQKTIQRLNVGAPDSGEGGFYVTQGKAADGDVYFQVTKDGVDIDPDMHGISLCMSGEAGLSGQLLMSRGYATSPIWTSDLTEVYFKSDISTQKYTKLNNAGMSVYDTSGSSPLSALYSTTAITRTIGSSSAVMSFPNKSGTIALTSDIPSASNFVTTNTSQTIASSKTFSSGTTFTHSITSKLSTSGYFLDCYSSASGATSSSIFGASLTNAGGSSIKPVGKVIIGQSGTECAIELAGKPGGAGNSLISQGSGKTPKWVDVTSADNISTVKYSIGTSSNVTFNNGGYGTYTSQTFNGYKVLTTTSSNGTQRYTHVYTTEFIKSVNAGRWVHFDGWRSGETILSVIVTPSKNTTTGYGPRMISWFTRADVYVAADDDNAPNGFSITIITRDN